MYQRAPSAPSASGGRHIHTWVQVRLSRPPIIQKTISLATCQLTTLSEMSSDETAVASAPSAMPASSSVATGVRPARVAIV